jgi:ABC-type multidrug transport system fused ATPase/permease subunit
LIDGRDLAQLQHREYRGSIAIVPQETFLFGDTIEENIRYGRPNPLRNRAILVIGLSG